MNIKIISIGKFSDVNQKNIFFDYLKKTPWKVSLVEVEAKISKNIDIKVKKDLEADLILKKVDVASTKIVLDEFGKQNSSVGFAKIIENFAIAGESNLNFIIGGANGLSDKVFGVADKKISLSLMTFPHMLVRVILAEQIYRACSIINNHPYHRE